jgi:hypothetical protein
LSFARNSQLQHTLLTSRNMNARYQHVKYELICLYSSQFTVVLELLHKEHFTSFCYFFFAVSSLTSSVLSSNQVEGRKPFQQ